MSEEEPTLRDRAKWVLAYPRGGTRTAKVIWYAVFKKYVLVPVALFVAGGVFWEFVSRLLPRAATPQATAAQPTTFTVHPPTASEVFALRSKCAELGDQIKDGNVIGTNLTQDVISHYEPKTNRCYVELTVQTADTSAPLAYLNRVLYDGQTKELLAFTRIDKTMKTGGVYVGASLTGDTAFEEANGFITKLMEDDRTR
jgi:hypothetical protein